MSLLALLDFQALAQAASELPVFAIPSLFCLEIVAERRCADVMKS
jgi:hypothetical protein